MHEICIAAVYKCTCNSNAICKLYPLISTVNSKVISQP